MSIIEGGRTPTYDEVREMWGRDRQRAGTQLADDRQGAALARLIRSWQPLSVHVAPAAGDLPPGAWLVTLELRTSSTPFVCGIEVDGRTSS